MRGRRGLPFLAGLAIWPMVPARSAAAGPAPPGVARDHLRQFGLSAQVGSGYRGLFPYGDEYCGDDAQQRGDYCIGRAPFFLDLGASYGVARPLELLLELRVGLERDFASPQGRGPHALALAPGVRLFFSDSGTLRIFSSFQFVLDFSDYGDALSGRDLGLKNSNGLQLDLGRRWGVYVFAGELFSWHRWFRFELEAGIGGQLRFL